jgi:hypothetical protein
VYSQHGLSFARPTADAEQRVSVRASPIAEGVVTPDPFTSLVDPRHRHREAYEARPGAYE